MLQWSGSTALFRREELCASSSSSCAKAMRGRAGESALWRESALIRTDRHLDRRLILDRTTCTSQAKSTVVHRVMVNEHTWLDNIALPAARRALNQLEKSQLFAGPTFQNCWSFGHHSSPLDPRALPLGRLTKRTPTHTPVPPNPAVEPLAVSFLNSFFWYELDIYIRNTRYSPGGSK
jgi:hypothetical protein